MVIKNVYNEIIAISFYMVFSVLVSSFVLLFCLFQLWVIEPNTRGVPICPSMTGRNLQLRRTGNPVSGVS
jgi:hypothetical protein